MTAAVGVVVAPAMPPPVIGAVIGPIIAVAVAVIRVIGRVVVRWTGEAEIKERQANTDRYLRIRRFGRHRRADASRGDKHHAKSPRSKQRDKPRHGGISCWQALLS